MAHEYAVRGGVGGPVFGIVAPEDLDGRAEWVPLPRGRSLLEQLEARLGSEVDLAKVLFAVLGPLRPALEGEALGVILREVPAGLAREIADADLNVGSRVRSPTGPGDYLEEVARLVLQPPWRAAGYVRAVFAAARAALPPDEARRVEARLPAGIAELWRTAR